MERGKFNGVAMISIIIPSKDEKRIQEVVNRIEELFHDKCEIIVSNDRYSKGKGWALRNGLSEAKGDIICFIDGDMDIDPMYIPKMLNFIKYYDIVIGRKYNHGRLSRKVISSVSRAFIGIIFGLWIDTQTGIKIFKRNKLPIWVENSFTFDIEILYKAKKRGARIFEYPIETTITKSMPIITIMKFIFNSMRLRWLLK